MDNVTTDAAKFAEIAGNLPALSEVLGAPELNWTAKHDVRALAPECWPQVTWPEWFPTHNGGKGVTDAQKATLFRKWQQNDNGLSWPEFVQGACPWDFGAVGVLWCGMFIGIETDGYPHT
jgi:hypothetical protein